MSDNGHDEFHHQARVREASKSKRKNSEANSAQNTQITMKLQPERQQFFTIRISRKKELHADPLQGKCIR